MKRNKTYIKDTLKDLKKVWKKFPELRLGQILLNPFRNESIYFKSDREIIDKIKEYYKDLRKQP